MTDQISRTHVQDFNRVFVRGIAGGALFGMVFTFIGQFSIFTGEREASMHNLLSWLIEVAAIAVAVAVAWQAGRGGLTAPESRGAAVRALVMGFLSVALFPVFWLGTYAVFSAASFVLGSRAVRSNDSLTRGLAVVGLLLGAAGALFSALLNMFG